MDFFEAQDRAKRNTGKLVLLYVLAVTGIIFSVYVVSIFLFYSQVDDLNGASVLDVLWNPAVLIAVSTIVFSVIALGTAFRIAQLRKGGSAVAQLLGGRRLEPSATDPAEKRLMNVVEEMSIASGLPVPDVYVLDNEENINAFAAGLTTHDAAVGVTKGALNQLTRDELQGVIAHEFSHIFNGDMRLNVRLIGVLNGILLIHMMGLIVIRSMMFSGGARRRNKDGKGGIAIVLFGVALIIIGYIGMLFGRMIQSAISRQREYLADAAAVQYTRNPDGLAGALNKIGLKAKGAEIKDGHAMEMSHLFFASSYHSALDKLFATHPPIEKRIQAISPSLAAGDERSRKKIREQFEKQHVSGSEQPAGATPGVAGHAALTPEVILAAIGTMDDTNLNRTGKLLQEIPESLRMAAHEPFEAEALVYSLLLANDSSHEENVPTWLINESEEMAARVKKYTEELNEGRRTWFLPLAGLALPVLRNVSRKQYDQFRRRVEKIIKDVPGENLFAFALEKMIVRQLDTAFSKKKDPEIRHHHLKTLGNELSVLLSFLAHTSGGDSRQAWASAIKPIEKAAPGNMKLLPKEQCRLEQLDHALDELAASANPVKKYVLSAVIHCIVADKVVTTDEKELLRAISEAMDIPIPQGI
ncbi:MAG: M48 family metallopeptidase [Balneolaceae bacterium]